MFRRIPFRRVRFSTVAVEQPNNSVEAINQMAIGKKGLLKVLSGFGAFVCLVGSIMFAGISYHLSSFEKHLETKFESKFDSIDTKFDSKFDCIDTKFDSINTKFDTKFDSMDSKLNMISEQIRGNDDVKEMNKRMLQLEVDKAIRDYHQSQKQ